MSAGGTVIPFDLLEPTERPYFDRFGNGLVAVLPGRRPGPSGWGSGGPPHGGAWIHLGEDGKARAFTGKVEVGQGTRTALSLVVAEELRLPLSEVELTMGDTDVCPWDMGTFGSRSMPDTAQHLRATGTAARAALFRLAATKLGVLPTELELVDGEARVRSAASPTAIGYGELVKGLRRVELVPPDTRPSAPSEWTRAGHPASDVAAREVVTGMRRYTSDLHLPGMLHGKLLFPPTYGAKLRRVDLAAARALPGVVAIHEGELVAVAAPRLLTVIAAVKAIRAEWDPTPQPSEREIVQYLRDHPAEGEDFWDVIHHESGDVEAALASAPVSIRETYSTAYIAHAPLETHAVLASWEGDRLTVWMGTQTPFRARDALSDALELPPSKVHIVVPPTGSGFGGKHASDLAVAAARLAKAADKPVRVAFSREEEFTQAYFRPLAVIDARSAATGDGTLSAWEFHVLNAGAAAAGTPYRVPNQRIDNQPTDSPLAQASYRALAATANNFARESHMDELAARLGADPVEYRLRHLADERLADVLRAVAARAGWVVRPSSGSGRGDGVGRGIAVGLEKGGRIATFAEVRVEEDRRLEVVRLVSGYECGAIVHPSNLRSQVEGGAVMALGGALYEAIHFEGGRVLNPRFSEYRVPRFRDVPSIEVVLLDRPDLPSQGGGETPLIAVAPAVANAIYDATGRRLRSLPLAPDGTVP
ncbi:MAG TPA: molybdopterin cofactor-binding domain-containing protein [Thermoplasmata archaeon]|nr:molybdopterin cofactor-binding domain-containing protein [Thermoplasmata archaeon]